MAKYKNTRCIKYVKATVEPNVYATEVGVLKLSNVNIAEGDLTNPKVIATITIANIENHPTITPNKKNKVLKTLHLPLPTIRQKRKVSTPTITPYPTTTTQTQDCQT